MIKYQWAGPDDERTCADVLNDLETAEMPMGSWRLFTWLHGKDEYRVVAWTDPGEDFPEDFDEEKAKAEFFKDIFKTFKV